MKKTLFLLAALMTLASCHQNPFLSEWDTPYGIPPFDKIRYSDYIPAVKQGIAGQQQEIAAIVSNPQAPSFDNTIVPLELSGRTLGKVCGVLFNVSETENTPELEEIVNEAVALTSENENEIAFNKALYERIAAVYNSDQSNLTREQQMVLKKHYDSYQREGIGLPEDQQEILKDINVQIAAKTQKIGNNILAESNAFKEKFGFSVSSYPEKMTTTEDRDLRRQYFEAYTSRGHNGNDNDNRDLICEVLELRIRKAKILGYENPAAYVLSNRMAATPQTVDAFLDGIIKAAVAKANEEKAEMEKIAGEKIMPWDWWYYAEKVRKAKYDLDDDQIRPYFKIDNVVKGVFTAAKTLYGVNMEKIEGVPVYNPCVTTYKVTDDEGSLIGIFTTDFHPRDSKRGGAWMNNYREQMIDAQGNDQRPIICNVCNMPEYLSVDDVQTVFHEFGHALHGLLSKCTYPSVSGTNVTRDFVEMFSQFNENWAMQPELLSQYAINDEGEVIPAELVEKINASLKFNQGFMTTELCAASILDMKWHELDSMDGIDIDTFEAMVCKEMGLISEIVPRYRTTYFNHIFCSGYQAGYYGYLWAEVLDKDAFSIFEKSGNVWNIPLARQFKSTFLERGGSEEPMTLYKSFAGREPDSSAALRARGLTD